MIQGPANSFLWKAGMKPGIKIRTEALNKKSEKDKTPCKEKK